MRTMFHTNHSGQKIQVHAFDPEETYPSLPIPTPRPQARRYHVMVKGYLGHWDWKIGYVTTHLDFQDWAIQNDVAEFQVYASRPASAEECDPNRLIDLF